MEYVLEVYRPKIDIWEVLVVGSETYIKLLFNSIGNIHPLWVYNIRAFVWGDDMFNNFLGERSMDFKTYLQCRKTIVLRVQALHLPHQEAWAEITRRYLILAKIWYGYINCWWNMELYDKELKSLARKLKAEKKHCTKSDSLQWIQGINSTIYLLSDFFSEHSEYFDKFKFRRQCGL
jgi:hypothetical protein